MPTASRGHGPSNDRPASDSGPGRPGVVRRITPDSRASMLAEAKRRYADGETVRVIAGEFGLSYGFVHALLASGGVEFRPRGGSTRRVPGA